MFDFDIFTGVYLQRGYNEFVYQLLFDVDFDAWIAKHHCEYPVGLVLGSHFLLQLIYIFIHAAFI